MVVLLLDVLKDLHDLLFVGQVEVVTPLADLLLDLHGQLVSLFLGLVHVLLNVPAHLIQNLFTDIAVHVLIRVDILGLLVLSRGRVSSRLRL